MTPALRAMVEAMAAEALRQAEAADAAEDDAYYCSSTQAAVARLDLEKVARAGLAAIRDPSEEVADAGGKAEPFMLPEGEKFAPGRIIANTSYRAMIDAILKETP